MRRPLLIHEIFLPDFESRLAGGQEGVAPNRQGGGPDGIFAAEGFQVGAAEQLEHHLGLALGRPRGSCRRGWFGVGHADPPGLKSASNKIVGRRTRLGVGAGGRPGGRGVGHRVRTSWCNYTISETKSKRNVANAKIGFPCPPRSGSLPAQARPPPGLSGSHRGSETAGRYSLTAAARNSSRTQRGTQTLPLRPVPSRTAGLPSP